VGLAHTLTVCVKR